MLFFRQNLFTVLVVTIFATIFPSFRLLAQPIQMTPAFQSSQQLLAQGSYDQAIEQLRGLLGRGNYHAGAMVEIGKIRQRQAEAQMSQALSNFNEAAESMRAGIMSGGVGGAELPRALYELGRLYEERLKNFLSAAEMYQRIIDEFPAFLSIDRVYFHLASCREVLGQTDKAATLYQKIVSDYSYSNYFPAAQEKMRTLSVGTIAEGSALEVQEELVRGATTYEEEARASLELADMHSAAGNFTQAAAAYRQAIDARDDKEASLEAYRKLIDLKDKTLKEYQQAADLVEEMIRQFPDAQSNPEYVYRLGRIYETNIDSMRTTVVDGRVRYRKSSENVMKALDYYNSLTDTYPHADISAEAFLRKGELYEKELSDNDQARQAYEEFLRRFPRHHQANEIRQKVRDMR